MISSRTCDTSQIEKYKLTEGHGGVVGVGEGGVGGGRQGSGAGGEATGLWW